MANDKEELSKPIVEPGAVPGPLRQENARSGGQSQPAAEPEGAATRLPEAELSTAPTEAQTQFSWESNAPGLAPETPAPEPVDPAPEIVPPTPRLATAEPSESARPGAQSPGETQFSMDSHTPEVPMPETPAPEPVDPAPLVFAPPPRLTGEQTKPRSLFPALAATAVAGAVLGFGGTLGLRYFGGSQINRFASAERLAALNVRIDAIEGKEDAASAASRAALAAIETRVAAAENAVNKAVESANSAQADAQKAFASLPAAQEPASGPAPAVPDLGPLEARIGTLEQKLAPLESALAAPKADLRAQPDREKAEAGEGSNAQAIAIVAESLLRKLDSGEPYSGEIAALENLGVPEASLAPLRAASKSTVASERQLTARFAALVPGIIASESAKQASADESFLDRLTRNAKGLLRIRRVGDAEAAGVQGFVARIENALTDHDLEAAYKAWKELPGAATTQSENWGEAAKARLEALNAARSIEADAVAVLGKPKS